MSRIIQYVEYRRKGLRQSWELSGMNNCIKTIGKAIAWTMFFGSLLFLMSERANAIGEAADNRASAKIVAQAQYIRELEKLTAACLSESSSGTPIKIGDEWFLCGIEPLGRFN